MPPKVKKVDPAVLQSQYDQWLQGEEYRVWTELYSVAQQLDNITETVEDLTGNWQIYHDKFFELVQAFKVKVRLKSFSHEHIRSFFFAREDEEIDKVIVKYIKDGFHCSVEKEYSVNAWNLRKQFVEIYRTLETVDKLQPDEFQAKRKATQKLINDFVKRFQQHVKSQHKHIDEKLQMLLAPLKLLLEVNRKLFFFEMKFRTPKEKQINDFILKVTQLHNLIEYLFIKAVVDQYCFALQECQKILYKQNQIQANPDVHRIFYKLNYENWEKNDIEKFYLLPLKKAFDKMKLNLLCLMTKGINFYKIPLVNNQQFMSDLHEVINFELISERLLGNSLKRDQLNFMFKVQSVIFDANPLSKEYLLKKDDNCIFGSIPKLTVYMTIIHMRNWIDKKAEDDLKMQEEKDKLAFKNKKQEESQLELTQQQTLAQSGFYISPEKKKQMEEEKKKEDQFKNAQEEAMKKQEQLDMEKYGRFWIWEQYCSQENREKFDQCVELIRHINSAVRQDIQDEIIREGMIPRIKDRQSKELKEATENLNKLRSKDNSNVEQIKKRPPELWNYPKIVNEKHDFRSVADPKKCYIDGRIEQLETLMKQLADHLITYKPQSWQELVNRIVDALNQNYDNKYSPIEEGK